VEERLPSKCKALSSVPSTEKKKKKGIDRELNILDHTVSVATTELCQKQP
jgi:hypothetical protein